jgi:nickel-dependent lactate racemase
VKVELAYGEEGLWVELPHRYVTVVESDYVPGIPAEDEAIRESLRAPLGTRPMRDLVGGDDTLAIVFSDLTRPQPRELMLSVLLEELSHVPREQIVLINALGTHRPSTDAELVDLLGPDLVKNYRVVQHDAWDQEGMVHVGETSRGHLAYVNGEYMRAKVRILTGFIEPHLFAGFSGGPKAVLPGVADARTVQANHGAAMIGDVRATWGVTDGNPIWEEMREVAQMTSPAFILNVAQNRDKQITGVFAGEMLEAHRAGTEFVASNARVAVAAAFDIVITTSSGYPLDLNLYQSVKGISAAAQVVKEGGSIVVAAECREGLPDYGGFAELLSIASSPDQLLALINSDGFARQDQWDAQILAQVLKKAQVYLKSTYLEPEEVRRAMLEPCESVEATVAVLIERYGPDATICVLPEGPMAIPYVEGDKASAR